MEPSSRILFTVQVEADRSINIGGQPQAFCLKERRVIVHEVLDRWDGDDHDYFKLRGDDGFLYILRHNRQEAGWEVTLMERT